MNAQALLKSLYKGAAIQSDVKIIGIKTSSVGAGDCRDCDDDCVCTF